MANMHILKKEGPEYTIAFHIDIPNTNNAAGLSFRTALLRSGIGGTTVLPAGDGTGGTISVAEKAQIDSGARFEVVETVRFASNQDGTQPSALRAMHAAMQTREQARLQDCLAQFGRIVD